MASVAAGVARFLAVESCGQGSPCKRDGIALSDALVDLSNSIGGEHGDNVVRRRLDTIAERSRCYLATQQQLVVGSILRHFGDELAAHASRSADPAKPELIAELLDIRGGRAYLDERHRQKQWDWSYNRRDSRTVPVELYTALSPPWRV